MRVIRSIDFDKGILFIDMNYVLIFQTRYNIRSRGNIRFHNSYKQIFWDDIV